ncbi:hypothetical protein JZ751_021834 [Albula glossodonta]|uniref:Membrane progestin receptor alpha n=1 Tax=Albula glossodonta TaxID=121402 RepID=A0A8T2MYZ4_9TELE|nr:hypothetical protein JZ751_021834 [Albula glossodonta]
MATIVMETIGHLFISLQQVRQVPQMLREAVPSVPGTLWASEVPPFFRVPYIHTGYRPPGQPWCYYFLSLFQRHNEAVNVWTHLLGALLVLFKALQLGETIDFAGDAHSWPLLILLGSAFSYLVVSAMAHLLSVRSELLHHALYFLDYVGVALYQYGSAAVHFYYVAGEGGGQWPPVGVFMLVAAVLAWLSCLGACWSKLQGRALLPWHGKACKVVPCAVAYAWDSGPVFLRLWSCLGESGCNSDPAVAFHGGQVSLFLLSAIFFACPLPERCFPGRCDFLPQGHQLFHVLLALCTLSQIQACYHDYMLRRVLYTHLHIVGHAPLLIAFLFAALVLTSTLTALLMTWRASCLIGQTHKTV